MHRHRQPAYKIASSAACPFCGSPWNYGVEFRDWGDVSSRKNVTCSRCGASGPTGATEAEAVAGWEFRPPPVPHGAEPTPVEFIDHEHTGEERKP